MICFFDTDIILKLAACDLLPQTLTTLGVTRHDVFVFREEAYPVYQYDPDVRASYTPEARRRALRFINSVQAIRDEPDPEEQLYMSADEHNAIDGGEQVMFAATRYHPDFMLLTADRKALRALTIANGCGAICARMSGRVLCLEQILMLLIAEIGIETVTARVTPCRACDAAFSEPFKPGASQDEVETVLRNRIALLRLQTRDLLVP